MSPSPPPSPWIERTFFGNSSRSEIRYLLYLPAAYETAPAPWPMILFLHGDGERGEDLALVKREGLPRLLEHNRDFRFVVVSPQRRRREKWSVDRLDRLLDHAVEAYRVDPRRIYATGLSSGAVASLALAERRPDRIAAAVAVSPNRTPDELLESPGSRRSSGPADSPGRDKPAAIWLFHNAFDERVPTRVSRRLARTLEASGSEVRLTIFPQAGHDAWSDAYARADLYAWLLEHHTGS